MTSTTYNDPSGPEKMLSLVSAQKSIFAQSSSDDLISHNPEISLNPPGDMIEVLRNAGSTNLPVKWDKAPENTRTIFDLFAAAAKQKPANKCTAYFKGSSGAPNWTSYDTVKNSIQIIGSALLAKLPPLVTSAQDITAGVSSALNVGEKNLLEASTGHADGSSFADDCAAPLKVLRNYETRQVKVKGHDDIYDPNAVVDEMHRIEGEYGQYRLSAGQKLRGIAVYSTNEYRHLIFSLILACSAYGITVFLLSPDIDHETVIDLIEGAQLASIVGNGNQIASFKKHLLSNKLPKSLKNLICFETLGAADKLSAAKDLNMRLVTWDNLLDGAKNNKLPLQSASSERLAIVFCHSSFSHYYREEFPEGTGIMMTNKGLLLCTAALIDNQYAEIFNQDTVHYSVRTFLDPLELAICVATVYKGGRIVFSGLSAQGLCQLNEIPTSSDENLAALFDDLNRAAKPTFLYLYPQFALALLREIRIRLTVIKKGFLAKRIEKALNNEPLKLRDGEPTSVKYPLFTNGLKRLILKYFGTVKRVIAPTTMPSELITIMSYIFKVPTLKICSTSKTGPLLFGYSVLATKSNTVTVSTHFAEFQKVESGAGIRVRGPQITPGYWYIPEPNNNKDNGEDKDGWVYLPHVTLMNETTSWATVNMGDGFFWKPLINIPFISHIDGVKENPQCYISKRAQFAYLQGRPKVLVHQLLNGKIAQFFSSFQMVEPSF